MASEPVLFTTLRDRVPFWPSVGAKYATAPLFPKHQGRSELEVPAGKAAINRGEINVKLLSGFGLSATTVAAKLQVDTK